MTEAPNFKYRNLPLLLLQARECILDRFRPLLQSHGLTEQQWRVIRLLSGTPPLEPRQIAALACISSPSLVGILARMERQGLIARRRHAQDRRRWHVELTQRARGIAAQMVPEIHAVYAQLFTRLGRPLMAKLESSLDGVLGGCGFTLPGDSGFAARGEREAAPGKRAKKPAGRRPAAARR